MHVCCREGGRERSQRPDDSGRVLGSVLSGDDESIEAAKDAHGACILVLGDH